MGRYRDNPAALKNLVQSDRVHRDVYVDREVFQLEMERLWSRAWVYVGDTSQVPTEGDYITVDVAAKPLLKLRHPDGSIRVLVNRCAHKGSKLAGDPPGNAGKALRCPYHAWTYRLDGSILNIPLKQGYDGTQLPEPQLPRVRGHAAPKTARRAPKERARLFAAPPSRCLHVLQQPEVEKLDRDRGEYHLRTPFLYTETRGEESQRYAATARHTLVSLQGRLRIRMKRVDILNYDAALPSIQLFL